MYHSQQLLTLHGLYSLYLLLSTLWLLCGSSGLLRKLAHPVHLKMHRCVIPLSPSKQKKPVWGSFRFGGESGIRTHEALYGGLHDFESCAFNRAPPSLQLRLPFNNTLFYPDCKAFILTFQPLCLICHLPLYRRRYLPLFSFLTSLPFIPCIPFYFFHFLLFPLCTLYILIFYPILSNALCYVFRFCCFLFSLAFSFSPLAFMFFIYFKYFMSFMPFLPLCSYSVASALHHLSKKPLPRLFLLLRSYLNFQYLGFPFPFFRFRVSGF